MRSRKPPHVYGDELKWKLIDYRVDAGDHLPYAVLVSEAEANPDYEGCICGARCGGRWSEHVLPAGIAAFLLERGLPAESAGPALRLLLGGLNCELDELETILRGLLDV